jgi:hypothetical protein
MTWMTRYAVATGDCFSANGQVFMDNALLGGNRTMRLVHGEVVGRGRSEGVHHSHCWIEDGDTVLDFSNGRSARMPKADYYAMGQIGDNVWIYDVEGFRAKVLEHEHWGPWDLQVTGGL